MKDLERWARLAASYLKPGGIFYMAELHPTSWIFDESASELRIQYLYFDTEPYVDNNSSPYADPTSEVKQRIAYEWAHPLGEILTALIQAGLQLEFVHEFPFTVYPAFPFLETAEDGYWYLPVKAQTIPLLFSVRARKI